MRQKNKAVKVEKAKFDAVLAQLIKNPPVSQKNLKATAKNKSK